MDNETETEPTSEQQSSINDKLKQLGLDEDIGEDLWKEIRKDRNSLHEWRQRALMCYDFDAGKQWDEEDEAKLEEQGRPNVVYNFVARTVNAVAGLEIQNRQEVRYLPREAGDAGTDEVLTAAAKWARDNCDAEDEESDSFRDLVISGMGWTETRMDYETDQEGSILIDRVDPLEIGWDRNAKKKNLDDSKRRWRVREYTKDEAESMWPGYDLRMGQFWPDSDEQIHNADTAWEYKNNQSSNEQDSGLVTVMQVQWVESEAIHVVLTEQGQIVQFDDERFEKIAEYVNGKGLRHKRIAKRVWYQAFMNGPDIMDVDKLDCNGFTLNCMTGIRDRNRNIWNGLVYCMIDPARWTNKFMSQIMHILNTNSKGGLLAELGAFANTRKAEDQWAAADGIVWLNDGGLGKVKEKGQTQYPQGFDRLMQYSQDAIPNVSGLNMEMLGLAGATNQVGIIEQSRRQAGISLLAEYFNGLRRYRKEQGRIMAHYILNYISDGRLIRIVGNAGEQYIPLLRKPDALKYDIVVDDAPSSPNQKMAVYAVLKEIAPDIMAMGIKPPIDTLDYLPLPQSLIMEWKKQLSQPDPEQEQAKKLALMDKTQEIEESKSKTALNYAKVQSEGVKPAVDIEKARSLREKQALDAFKVGADVANPNRGNL